MRKPNWEMDKLFPILCRIIEEEQSQAGYRLISSGEIARRLSNDNEAEAMIDAAKQHLPGLTVEQLAGDIVASFGQGVAKAGSEWQSLVAAVQIDDEWFFRLKPQKIASAAHR
jgi:hypothetical protein